MIILIAAITPSGVIGKTGEKLPWHIPEEIKLFKALTLNHVVVMGRKTYESIGSPLPKRVNIVVSQTLASFGDVRVYRSLPEALDHAKSYERDVFVIGGAKIFEQALQLNLVDRLYLSHLKQDFPGDVYFPKLSSENWLIERREAHEAFDFIVYRKPV